MNAGSAQTIPSGDENRVTAVLVFPSEAHVTREAHIEVDAGVQRLLVETQAFELEPASVQARVFGHGGLLSVQYRQIPVTHAPQEALRELETLLRQLKRQRRRLGDARELIAKQRRFLDSTLDYAEVELPREIKSTFPSAEQMGEMVDFMDQRYSSLEKRDDKLMVELEALDDEIGTMERQLKKARHREDNTRRVIEILFDAAERQSLRIEASYTVKRTGWSPFYKADVDADLSGLRLTQLARIRQASGEHWDQVRLSLSTAEPLYGTLLPRARRWILRQPEPEFLDVAMAAPVAAGAAEGELLEELDEEQELEVSATVVQARRRVLPTAFEYHLPMAVDVPSGEDDTLLTLDSRPAEGRFHHHCVPQQDSMAYLVCESAADPQLPPGALNIHFDGRYVGATELGDQAAGEPLRLNLGADRSVRIKRENLIDKSAETFFRLVERKFMARELAYRITLENLREEVVDIALFDSVPTSVTDRYVVQGVELKPEPTDRDWDGQEGVMRWSMRLAPGEAAEVSVRFYVKYPRGERPEGL